MSSLWCEDLQLYQRRYTRTRSNPRFLQDFFIQSGVWIDVLSNEVGRQGRGSTEERRENGSIEGLSYVNVVPRSICNIYRRVSPNEFNGRHDGWHDNP